MIVGIRFLLQVAMADVNNDEVMDIVKLDNVSGDVEWFNKIKDGPSTPNTISNSSIISRPGKFLVVDIDGDSQKDVILTDGGASDDAIIWFKGADNSSPSATPTLIDDNNYQMYDITTEDFDSDSDTDIAIVGNFSNTVDWYENQLVTLGLDTVQYEAIRISPNPTSQFVNFDGLKSEEHITIYNMLGHEILQATVNNNTSIDIAHLASGVYIITFDDFGYTERIIKQ